MKVRIIDSEITNYGCKVRVLLPDRSEMGFVLPVTDVLTMESLKEEILKAHQALMLTSNKMRLLKEIGSAEIDIEEEE